MRVVRGLVLVALAALIGRLLVSGQMALYMSPALDPITGMTGLMLAAMGVFEVLFGLRRADASPDAGHVTLTDQALTLLLVWLPIGLGLFMSPRALGSAAVSGQDLTRLVVAFSSAPPANPVRPPTHPIEDVADLFHYLRDAGEGGVGQPVHLLGIVARSDTLPADQFVLLRFSIVHCVADAQPLGVLIVAPSELSLESDHWVEVEGTLASEPRGSERLVGIHAERIMPSDEPPDPYIQAF
jgi:uncharacterized repeat protein (TIGR03943 family)